MTKGWTEFWPYAIPANKLSFCTSALNSTKGSKAIAPSSATGVHCSTTLSFQDSGITLEMHSQEQGTTTKQFTATRSLLTSTLNVLMHWGISELSFFKQITSIKQSPSTEKPSKLIDNSQKTIFNSVLHYIKQNNTTRLLNVGEKSFNYNPTIRRPWGISG